ncbi:MAG: hypothetical protein A2516_06885 [Alphaproteobacteria bacterium RIFOXYD12_FULL_60_8]|nr:MAG: hypothetical protein A2516_06885 [Alphaproteobacteria bacterium RIFOXYD12_FULL_60_8]
MLTLYDDLLSRNGYKVRLLLRHLDKPFHFKRVDLKSGMSRQPDFLTKNVVGRIPVVEFEDGSTLAESDAILFFLAEDTAFLPDDRRARAEVLRWMFFEQSMILPTIGTARIFRIMGLDKKRPDVYAHRLEIAHDALAALERHLDGKDWLVGKHFTIADIALFGYLSVAEEAGLDIAAYGRVLAWRKRIADLPSHVNWDWTGEKDISN